MKSFIYTQFLIEFSANTTDFTPCDQPNTYTFSCVQVRGAATVHCLLPCPRTAPLALLQGCQRSCHSGTQPLH